MSHCGQGSCTDLAASHVVLRHVIMSKRLPDGQNSDRWSPVVLRPGSMVPAMDVVRISCLLAISVLGIKSSYSISAWPYTAVMVVTLTAAFALVSKEVPDPYMVSAGGF